jgi:hypothetical protein
MTVLYCTGLLLPPVVSVSVFISTTYRTLGSTHVQSIHTPTFFSRFRESEALSDHDLEPSLGGPRLCSFIHSYDIATQLSSVARSNLKITQTGSSIRLYRLGLFRRDPNFTVLVHVQYYRSKPLENCLRILL